MCPRTGGRFAEGTERSVNGAESNRRLFREGHHDVAGNGRVTGKIKAGNGGTFFDLMNGGPADFLV